MKTLIAALLSCVALAAQAQDDSAYGTADSFELTPAVVYEAPVIYLAPVLYQAPVVYYAPVYYLAAPLQVEPPAPCAAPSTVVYIGGRGSTYSYSHCGNCSPSVIYFGAQQASVHGYRFNNPR